ncbi:MAG: tRNA (adenosine(37)-N6)-threonylcarbamoyltransferase complex dimerization subunit type 1 TsaB [Bacteroidales bacterium]|nr:tRNA (adenosine(37)-N6)-threonylcarbamoyltransferase complex dimerization subunit type 1 TsaB [Candidatus Cacconaster merdequi]
MSSRILAIETSTECCSVALFEDERLLAKRSSNAPKVHASMLVPFIDQVLKEGGCSATDLDAVAVSEGPGSYTGLRVGVSTAKGICFGTGKPLLAIDTLQILALRGISHECAPQRIIPFIDARRMEVYTAIFDGNGSKLSETAPVILDENSFSEELSKGPVLFIGTGVEKFRGICKSPNAFFVECYPMADYMASGAFAALKKKEFKDIAYFEPFYLKDFMIGVSKKSLLQP